MYGVVLRWCQPPQTSPSGWPEPPPAVPCHFFSPKRIVLHGIPIKSPTGKKFRSKPQLSRYLGNTVDLGCFDFRTGKMMPGKLQKNKQRLRHDPLSLSKEGKPDQEGGREKGKEQKKEGRKEQGGKPDLNTALPIRQTASIFKQPVTKVTSHPGNKVKADLQRGAEQPRQGAGAESVPGQEESGGGADGRRFGAGRRKHPRAAGGEEGLKTDSAQHLDEISIKHVEDPFSNVQMDWRDDS
ncbi:methyl-CpG-binding domain protein 2 isoform X6 [Siniperca chuatsi]|uniref:methyl-CpG-binding domain protein 2 isoform X6 n=1 Tax=Siniperca chuatsi TaxID=119488 RepID=UPI001CE14110|nr:methyl-CpG-binding domain protein 2 isoform X6 [Siniperca chuatsi]